MYAHMMTAHAIAAFAEGTKLHAKNMVRLAKQRSIMCHHLKHTEVPALKLHLSRYHATPDILHKLAVGQTLLLKAG